MSTPSFTPASPYLYITTPIYYVNDRPHLGHAYTSIAADILARFWKMAGVSVKLATGTDEHGLKVHQAAQKQGIDPQTYVDQMAESFQKLIKVLDVEADDFIRTSQERHKKAAQSFWKILEEKGHIYLGSYAGWYAIRDEAFYNETELVNGLAPTGAPVEWVEEPCFFFRLSAWQEPLLAYYQEHPEAIGPEERRNEVLSFIRSGLRDLAVSRTKLSWGIPVPDHPDHVMYVWIDALVNYITVLGYPQTDQAAFQDFWPQSLHLVGKDILRFHSVYWPAFLMAAGLQPPHRVFAHGWWTREGEKMSKSLGNVVEPFSLIAQYGLDPVRYFLFREVRFGQDGDYSDRQLIQRNNQELADAFGNLAQRVLSFIQQYGEGKIPALSLDHPQDISQDLSQDLLQEARALQNWGLSVLPSLMNAMKKQDIHTYLDLLYQGLQKANAYMTKLAPWLLRKDVSRHQEMNHGLHTLVMMLRDFAILFSPVVPQAASHLKEQLGGFFSFQLQDVGAPLPLQALPKPFPIFRKFETNAKE